MAPKTSNADTRGDARWTRSRFCLAPESRLEASDAAIALSTALQHGADLGMLRRALTRVHDGGAATLCAGSLAAR
jgi:hypothetical protein